MPTSKDCILRPARADERPALVALQARAALANPGDRALLEAHPELIDTPLDPFLAGNVFLVEREGVPIGFAELAPREDGGMELEGLFVEPAYWGQGIGRLLIDAARERSRELGATTLHVIGNPHAEGFYARLGFRCHGKRALQHGTGLFLTLSLGFEQV